MTYDILGVGFGPSNLALAIAASEPEADAGLRVGFLERQPRFGWHRGMLLDDATMQVSFLKDLVTQRNPTSDFSFLCYLQERGRLADFINHKTLFPLRVEFHDYLEWAADRVANLVTYDRTVTAMAPVTDDHGVVVAFDVTARDGQGREVTHRARNVVVALGLAPNLPPGITRGPRVWHNLDLLDRVATFPETPEPRRFVVVGAGQSAAEVVDFLHRRYQRAEVCSVFSKWGYTPADDTPYANRIFDPGAVDLYFGAGDGVKRMLFDYHRNTNYSVVDAELIEELYRREYQEAVLGERRLRMMNASQVVGHDARPDAVTVDVEFLPTGERARLEADAVVYATGYTPGDATRLLGEAADLVERRADGLPAIERDYRLALNRPAEAAIYVQGGTEHTHGISSTLLSNIAVRSGEIVESVMARGAPASRRDPRPVERIA